VEFGYEEVSPKGPAKTLQKLGPEKRDNVVNLAAFLYCSAKLGHPTVPLPTYYR
jgi:hypothetical protein